MSLANRILVAVIGIGLSLDSTAALGDVVAVVSAGSALTGLSRQQVAAIFLGRTSQFPSGDPAVPIDQAEGSAARDEFYAKFADKSPAQIKAHWSKIIFTGRGQPPKEVPNGAEVKKELARNPNAIGYIDRNTADASVKVLPAQ